MPTNLITVEDQAAALLCRLAAARLEMDDVKIRALLRRLDRYTRPLEAAEQLARTAIDAERDARKGVLQ